MGFTVSFELSDEDLGHFQVLMQSAADAVQDKSEDEIIDAGRQLLVDVRAADSPNFVLQRLDCLETLLQMCDLHLTEKRTPKRCRAFQRETCRLA